MTWGELEKKFRGAGHDTEVRIASMGHRSHFEYAIEDSVKITVADESKQAQPGDTLDIIYLSEGEQIGYLPEEVRNSLK